MVSDHMMYLDKLGLARGEKRTLGPYSKLSVDDEVGH